MISRKIINHIFHNRFAYRVSTTYPAHGYVVEPYPFSTGISCYPATPEATALLAFQSKEQERYRSFVNSFMQKCLKHVPADTSKWMMTKTVNSLHFYFIDAIDMETFVSGNQSRIKTIYQPCSDQELDIFKSDKTVRLRNSLFFNQYQYCITFKTNASLVRNLDEWVEDFFGTDDPVRCRYSSSGVRKLYLSVETDILAVQLAFNRAVSKIEKIILRSDLSNEDTVSEKIG